MIENAIPAHDELPLTLVQHLDQVCSTFEAACQAAGASGPFPMIEGFLDGCIDPERSLLLHELILLEVHYRRRRGEPACAKDFVARFPQLDLSRLAAALDAAADQQHDTPVSAAPEPAHRTVATDANLLFGILALQADAITRDQFVEACTLWANAKN